jgi:ATP-dependent RNA circularization protein (DNA/RNA ligase family)
LSLKYRKENTLWKVSDRYNLYPKLKELGLDIALQGEVVGPGIQGNPYKLQDHDFYLFNIWDIKKGKYYKPNDRYNLSEELNIQMVPLIDIQYKLNSDIKDILAMADGESKLCNTKREGLVFKCINNPILHFKAISNKFLLDKSKR